MRSARHRASRLLPSALVCLLAAALSAPTARAQSWTPLTSGTSADLLAFGKVSYTPRVVGRGGFHATLDPSHTSWTSVPPGTSSDLYSVVETTQGQVWVGGTVGTARVFTGGSWQSRNVPDNTQTYVLFSNASGTAFAAGSAGALYYSGDIGLTWSPLASGTTRRLRDGVMDWPYGWVVGDHGTILTTTNITTWSPVASGTTADLYSIVRVATSVYLAVGAGGTILRCTEPYGTVWAPVASGTTATLRSVTAYGGSLAFAVGDGGTVLKSTDAGLTWCRLDAGTQAQLNAVFALNSIEAYIAGNAGLLLYSTNFGGACQPTGVAGPASGSGSGAGVRFVVPAILRGYATATVTVPTGGDLEIALYDADGRHAATCYRGSLAAGSTTAVRMDVSRLAPGAYFARLTHEGRTTAQRVLVLR